MIDKIISDYMRELQKRSRRVITPAMQRASRRNGRKGGRPKKKKSLESSEI